MNSEPGRRRRLVIFVVLSGVALAASFVVGLWFFEDDYWCTVPPFDPMAVNEESLQ